MNRVFGSKAVLWYDGEQYAGLTKGAAMRRILIVIDMQNDFIDGSLGTKEAQAIVKPAVERIAAYDPADIYATRDTHTENYLDTQEGKNLPVPHCIKDTDGWEIRREIKGLIPEEHIFDKPTFGSLQLAETMRGVFEAEDGQAEFMLIGLCTDICVVSNALLLKAYMPEAPIQVDASCCAGVTPEKHIAALETMRSCQIQVL